MQTLGSLVNGLMTVGYVWWMKSTIIFLVLLCLFGFFPLTHVVHFSALISSIYWCGSVSHQQILLVRHVGLVEIIGASNAEPATPVSTPMHHARIQRGWQGSGPPGKSQVIWVSIANKQLDRHPPPLGTPPPLGKVGPPPPTWKKWKINMQK